MKKGTKTIAICAIIGALSGCAIITPPVTYTENLMVENHYYNVNFTGAREYWGATKPVKYYYTIEKGKYKGWYVIGKGYETEGLFAYHKDYFVPVPAWRVVNETTGAQYQADENAHKNTSFAWQSYG